MTARLGHDVHGPEDAPVVVLGSSLGTTRSMWDEQLPVLCSTFRVVRYDHRGHGGSDVPPGPYRLDDLVCDLMALLDSLGVERAHHAGVSLGGMVAMQLAATAPERVDRLALVCTAAHLPATQAWLDRAETVRSSGTAAVTDAVAERWFTPSFAATARAGALREAMRALSAEGYAACCEAIAAMDLRPLLAVVRAPTLVIAGADDRATPPDMGRAIADAVNKGGGSARMQVVDGAAHLAGVERAGRVTDLLLEHFGAHAATDRGAHG